MERIDINKNYNSYELSKIKHTNRNEIGDLPIHEVRVIKYVVLLSYYPFNEQKWKIFKSLSKNQKMGMLNRHVLSVARQLGVSDILLKKAKEITKDLASSTKRAKRTTIGNILKPNFYKEQEERYRRKLEEYYTLILDIIMEETSKRMNVKYLRKKKLDEIIQSGTQE